MNRRLAGGCLWGLALVSMLFAPPVVGAESELSTDLRRIAVLEQSRRDELGA